MSSLSILHLYPDALHLNGEIGNLTALQKRAELAGIRVRISNLMLGMSLPSARPDLIFIGSGTLQATKTASVALQKIDQQIHSWIIAGTKVLAVGSGFDLVSQGLILKTGEMIFGLGLTNTTHQIGSSHLVGEVFVSKNFAGFLNTDRLIIRGDESLALGQVRASDNPALVGYVDGYRDGKVWASNIQGPFLPMNPHFADEILSSLVPGYQKSASLKTIDSLASKARAAISGRVGN